MWRALEKDTLHYILPLISVEGTEFARMEKIIIQENVDKWITYELGDKPFHMHLKACVNHL